jgi:hypothetical protein
MRRWPRRGAASVTSTDYVPALLEGGRRRAEAGRVRHDRFEVADARPCMRERELRRRAVHLRRHVRADHECAASGCCGSANPAPGSGSRVGRRLASSGSSFASSAVCRRCRASALLSCAEAHLHASSSRRRRSIEHATRTFAFRYRSPEHWVDVFRTYYGPVTKRFSPWTRTASPDSKPISSRSFAFGEPRRAGLVVPGEYLETVITK